MDKNKTDNRICKCGHDEHMHGTNAVCQAAITASEWCPCNEFENTKEILCQHCGHSINEHTGGFGCMATLIMDGITFSSCACEHTPEDIAIHAIDIALSNMAKDVVETIYVRGAAIK